MGVLKSVSLEVYERILAFIFYWTKIRKCRYKILEKKVVEDKKICQISRLNPLAYNRFAMSFSLKDHETALTSTNKTCSVSLTNIP